MEEGMFTVVAVVKQSFEEHIAQLYCASALLCKGSALVTVKNIEYSNRRKEEEDDSESMPKRSRSNEDGIEKDAKRRRKLKAESMSRESISDIDLQIAYGVSFLR